VKKISGQDKFDGVDLMRRSLSKNNPVIAFNKLETQEDKDEQEGVMHLFEGAMLAFRNPPSHDDEKEISKEDAMAILSLANYLLRKLDSSISTKQ